MYCRRSAVDDDRSRKTRLAVDDDRRQRRWAVDDARSRIAFYQAQSKESLDRVDRNLDLIRENLRAIRKMRKMSATIPRYSPSSSSISSFASRRHRLSRHDYPPLELPLRWREPPPLKPTKSRSAPFVGPLSSGEVDSDFIVDPFHHVEYVQQLVGTRQISATATSAGVQDLANPAGDLISAHSASDSPTQHVSELDLSLPDLSINTGPDSADLTMPAVTDQAPVVVTFSARGPSPQFPEILKPNVIAPGLNFLAAWPDTIGSAGTSMAHTQAPDSCVPEAETSSDVHRRPTGRSAGASLAHSEHSNTLDQHHHDPSSVACSDSVGMELQLEICHLPALPADGNKAVRVPDSAMDGSHSDSVVYPAPPPARARSGPCCSRETDDEREPAPCDEHDSMPGDKRISAPGDERSSALKTVTPGAIAMLLSIGDRQLDLEKQQSIDANSEPKTEKDAESLSLTKKILIWSDGLPPFGFMVHVPPPPFGLDDANTETISGRNKYVKLVEWTELYFSNSRKLHCIMDPDAAHRNRETKLNDNYNVGDVNDFTAGVEISGLNLADKVDHQQCLSAARHNVKVGHLNEVKTKLLARQYTGCLFYTESFGPLEDDTVYYYRCGGQEPDFQFKTPPKFPLTFAVVGVLGQTDWTASTLSHINDCQYDLHLHPGDLSYTDYLQHLWDSFGELIQPYANARPWMETEGNHEMESIPFIKSPFQSYNARWKMPYAESGFTSNLYYPFEVAGVHVIMLGSYTDYGEYSDQYAWLKAEFGCPYGFPTKVQKTDVVNADELEYNERVDDSVSKHQVIRLLFAYDSRLTFRLSGTGPEGVTIRLYIEQYVNNSSRIRGTHRKPLHVLILKPAFKVFDPGICFHLTSILSIESRPESSSFYARGE